jgi:undecaprenyl diphosphate synthase
MIQRALPSLPHHVAVVMDGNGRWATRRGLPRAAGHAAGAGTVRRIVEAAARRGIPVLTLYAFSGDNWRRPESEVAALFRLFERFLEREQRRCVRHGIRLEVIGRRDRLPLTLRRAIADAERATVAGRAMTLRIALDYSARDAIVRAVAELGRAARASHEGPGTLDAGTDAATDPAPPSRERFGRALAAAMHASGAPDVDLLLRTGGEHRLSDFLLWECAYAELVFLDTLWPDVGAADLDSALAEFARRDRRFGAAPAPLTVRTAPGAPPAPVPLPAARRAVARTRPE